MMEENVKIIIHRFSLFQDPLVRRVEGSQIMPPSAVIHHRSAKAVFTLDFCYFFFFSASQSRRTTSWWIGPKTLNFRRKRLMFSREFSFLLSLRCLTFGTGAITWQNHTNSSAEIFSLLYARFKLVRGKLKTRTFMLTM